jgi:ketosteroid isomerase-like protein
VGDDPVLTRLVAAINNHDTAAVASCYAPDAWVHQSDWPEPMAAADWIQAFPMLYCGSN